MLDTTTRLIDEGVALFDRAVGRMFQRAEAQEKRAVLRDARAVNDKVRLLAKLGAALVEAKQAGENLGGAVAASVGWERLAASIAEVQRLARPDKADLPALAARAWPVLHRLGPLFLGTFRLRAVPATLRGGTAADGRARLRQPELTQEPADELPPNINLTGDYLWGADGSFGPDGFRPPRNLAASARTAAA